MVILGLVVFVSFKIGLWLTSDNVPRYKQYSRTEKCRVIVREYELESSSDLGKLPPQIRSTWDFLGCDSWLQDAGTKNRKAPADALRVFGEDTENATDRTDSEVTHACPQPCADSWSPGRWVEWCPPFAKQCGHNFVLQEQRCLFHWFDRKETAVCMKNNWMLLLGGSSVMNLGLTWLSSLDPVGTAEPFFGPRWYNKTCMYNRTHPCEKSWYKKKDTSFINFQVTSLHHVFD